MIDNKIKNFDIVTPAGIETVGVRELTLKEREALFIKFEETIKNRRRKEYLEMSKLLEGKEKTKYLVECANSLKVETEEIINESQTFAGIVEIFKITASKQLDWLVILSDEEKIFPVLKALYYSLGVEVPDIETEDIKENTKVTEAIGDGSTQSATF